MSQANSCPSCGERLNQGQRKCSFCGMLFKALTTPENSKTCPVCGTTLLLKKPRCETCGYLFQPASPFKFLAIGFGVVILALLWAFARQNKTQQILIRVLTMVLALLTLVSFLEERRKDRSS
jgi:rubredoxin